MRRLLWLAAAAGLLFVSVAFWFGRPIDNVWNSPDEAANVFWAERVASGESLSVRDEIVGLGAGAVHPRSMGVVGDALVPGSFPGLILLYGAFKLLLKLPLYIYTPLLTALAGALFGLLAARLFDRKVGIWAAVLFFIHPAILYYGARGLFHNVLFIDLLIIAAALFVLRPLRPRFGLAVDDLLGGFVFGWAIVTRTSEALWVIPAFAAFLPFAGKDRWRRLGAAAAGALVPLLVFLHVNMSVYGSPFRMAYTPPAAPVVASTPDPKVPGTDAVPGTSESASVPILPFGFHPRLIVRHVREYGLLLFWWQTLLAAAGFLWWAARWRRTSPAQKTYALAALLTAGWLAILYGSWLIRDRFDPADITIGTSYVRYFLPAYVAALPFAALALVRLGEALRRTYVPVLCAGLSAVLGVWVAVYAGDEGLRAVRLTLEGNAAKKQVLLEWIPPDSVIMTERFDKLLMPERLRIIPAADDGAFEAAARLTQAAPVFWYGLDPAGDEERRLTARAEWHGLDFYWIGAPVAGEALYGIDFPSEHDE